MILAKAYRHDGTHSLNSKPENSNTRSLDVRSALLPVYRARNARVKLRGTARLREMYAGYTCETIARLSRLIACCSFAGGSLVAEAYVDEDHDDGVDDDVDGADASRRSSRRGDVRQAGMRYPWRRG